MSGGLEGIRLPVAPVPTVNIDHAAAIAKAVTGAYLSSEGNAFSSRTASQIVQEHFNPREQFQPAGPLFGVQFSQLACSDLMRAFDGVGPSVGPQRSPLGLSADPGGFPLYKSGTVVGGVGVLADGFYTIDKDIADSDADVDEAIGYAATFGFAAPVDRRGDRITADGKTLRFSDVDFNQLRTQSRRRRLASARSRGSVGALVPVPGYFDGVVRAGTSFGQAASGIRADGDVNYPGRDAFVLVDAANALRYPPRAGTDGALIGGAVLTQSEVRTVLQSALDVANRARAQIRRPVGSQARVTISVVDTQGEILGIARTRDAPVFGTDVSLQKARTAAFMSSSTAAAFLAALPDAKYLTTSDTSVSVTRAIAIGSYVTALRTFLDDGSALADGRIAYTDRANGNLSRPFFPDGIDNEGARAAQQAGGRVEPVLDRLQLDVAINAILQHVLFVAGAGVPDVAPGCAGVAARERSQQRRPDDHGRAARQRPADLPGQRADLSRRHARRRGRCVRRRRRSGRHDRVPRLAQCRSIARRRARQRAGRSSRRHCDRRRACGCATCNARKHRSSTALKTTCARGSDMKDNRKFMALALVLLTTGATAAETCYQDDTGRIVKRRRPGYTEVPCPEEGAQPGATPSAEPNAQPQEDTGRAPRRRVIERAPPAYVSPIPRPGLADYVDSVPVPDRWRIVDTLGYKERWFDPYNRNVLKADRPVHGDEWFFNLGVISDTVYELREVPTPVGGISTDRPAASTCSAAPTSGPRSKTSRRSSSITRATRSSSRRTTSSASRRCSATTTSSSKRCKA